MSLFVAARADAWSKWHRIATMTRARRQFTWSVNPCRRRGCYPWPTKEPA